MMTAIEALNVPRTARLTVQDFLLLGGNAVVQNVRITGLEVETDGS